jgi:hypothetical protein
LGWLISAAFRLLFAHGRSLVALLGERVLLLFAKHLFSAARNT